VVQQLICIVVKSLTEYMHIQLARVYKCTRILQYIILSAFRPILYCHHWLGHAPKCLDENLSILLGDDFYKPSWQQTKR